ncbi:hypothetical protein IR083_19925 [Dysgonomonas sp. GY75]|uniref:hypothetical protein n=1 Tax=Dysgonomonas sp. GY75 TaxID=2780419 RepID=UPI0018840BC5|nr:hypothetical protein [Dysgonomonas sp. GY75]MBF0651089.1 hypothetical protein [Dysgonomonas sp. GY75]
METKVIYVTSDQETKGEMVHGFFKMPDMAVISRPELPEEKILSLCGVKEACIKILSGYNSGKDKPDYYTYLVYSK